MKRHHKSATIRQAARAASGNTFAVVLDLGQRAAVAFQKDRVLPGEEKIVSNASGRSALSDSASRMVCVNECEQRESLTKGISRLTEKSEFARSSTNG